MRTGLTKQEKTTDIWFDEKDSLIHIRTHNTALKKRLAAYAGQHPDQCRQTDTDPDTGCMEFEIRKGRFSFRLTAPYNEERRQAASRLFKSVLWVRIWIRGSFSSNQISVVFSCFVSPVLINSPFCAPVTQ